MPTRFVPSAASRSRIESLLAEIGLDSDHPRLVPLRAFDEAVALVTVPGTTHRLTPPAARAWAALRASAEGDGVALALLSGFRDYAYQAGLIRRACAEGRPREEVLRSIAPPGYSEHHTGEAVDIGTPEAEDLTASFGDTAACAWLGRHARGFGWTMTYPPGNRYGFVHEPWHWKWHSTPLTP